VLVEDPVLDSVDAVEALLAIRVDAQPRPQL
jgi:hypothetical protein